MLLPHGRHGMKNSFTGILKNLSVDVDCVRGSSTLAVLGCGIEFQKYLCHTICPCWSWKRADLLPMSRCGDC
jgi:hypothetical protein